MRIVETKVFKFNELSKEAQEVAIKSILNQENYGIDIPSWVVDDCALFEPKEAELIELFGKDYNFPLIKNTREEIFYSVNWDYFLDVEKAMEITNVSQFYTWLGINKELQEKIDTHDIYTPHYIYIKKSTTIDFEVIDEEEITDAEEEILKQAEKKFNNHISTLIANLRKNIDYYYTDEYVIESEVDKYEFLENGKIYK